MPSDAIEFGDISFFFVVHESAAHCAHFPSQLAPWPWPCPYSCTKWTTHCCRNSHKYSVDHRASSCDDISFVSVTRCIVIVVIDVLIYFISITTAAAVFLIRPIVVAAVDLNCCVSISFSVKLGCTDRLADNQLYKVVAIL